MDPLEVDLPYVRSLIVVRKSSSAARQADAHTRAYYLSSRLPGPAETFAAAIRGHWGGCEIRNHWVRDALWGEDRTRSKHWHLNATLALLRAGLIALRALAAPDWTWAQLFEHAAFQVAFPWRLLHQSPSK